MRSLALATTLLALLVLAAPSASAAPDVCDSTSADAGFVKATVEYGVGVGCIDAEVERCTLETNPEYPSHPYWRCTRVI